MKISIITCCLNSEPFIAKCVESVSKQTYLNIEHLFVDGGSNDGTLERIQSLTGNIKWVTDIRGGISNAMNVGAELATGDIIIHLHGDDYFIADDVVAHFMYLFAENPRIDWAFGKISTEIDGRLIPQQWKIPNYSYQRLLKGNFIAHPAVFMRKEIFQKSGGFDVSLKYAMDYDLWLRLASSSAPKYLDTTVSVFRCHAGSASTANAFNAFIEDHKVRIKYIKNNYVIRLYHDIIYLWRGFKRRRNGE